MCIEDALRTVIDRLSFLRLAADSLARTDDVNPQSFSGLADIVSDIEQLLARAKDSLDVEALAAELSTGPRRSS